MELAHVILVVVGIATLFLLSILLLIGIGAMRLNSKFSREDEKKTELYYLKQNTQLGSSETKLQERITQ